MSEVEAIQSLLRRYFDGLYFGDTAILRMVFHPQALYACAAGGPLLALDMESYFAVVDERPSPAGRGDSRHDRVLSIELIGPVTALARVECRISPRQFTDLLSLVKVDGEWRVIAKVFHYDVLSGS